MKKFETRIELFKDILIEVSKFRIKYKEEINHLNLKLRQIITNFSNKFQTVVAKKTRSKYSDEDPFSDKLMSDGVQQLLTYFLNEYNIVSDEINEINDNIILKLTKGNKSEYLKNLNLEQKNYNKNLSNMTKAKNKYYTMMSKLEEQIYKLESCKTQTNTDDAKINNNHDLKDKKLMLKIPQLLREEVVQSKENYLLALDTLNLTKREYLNKANSFDNEIKDYNFSENEILKNIFLIFKKFSQNSTNNLNNFLQLCEQNKTDLLNHTETQIFNNEINKEYVFEEYIPQHNNLTETIDINVLIEMSKCSGFNIENSFSEPLKKKEIKFILIMEKLVNDYVSLRNADFEMLKEMLNEKKYIEKFSKKLNDVRIKGDTFNDKVIFDVIVDLFNFIFEKLINENNLKENYLLIFNLMTLSQTFYMTEDNKNNKIYLSKKINDIKEFKNTQFWIEIISIEIENKIKESKLENKNEEASICFLGNSVNFNDFLCDKSKIKEVFNFFNDKYSFNEGYIKAISEHLGFQIVE